MNLKIVYLLLLGSVIFLSKSATCQATIEDGFKSVCLVYAYTDSREQAMTGTGFFFKETKDKYQILSAGHIIKDNNKFAIKLYYNGKQSNTVKASLVRYLFNPKKNYDTALLEVDKEDVDKYGHPYIVQIAQEKDSLDHKLGVTIGFPVICDLDGEICERWFIAYSVIVNKDKNDEGYTKYYSGIGLIPGHSGGPLFDEHCTKVYGLAVRKNGEFMTDGDIRRFLDAN